MNTLQKTMVRAMTQMAEDRGATNVQLDRETDGFRLVVYAGKELLQFAVPYVRLENQGYKQVLGEFRDALIRCLGALPGELLREREEAQRELGKQKTPFRPGRHRVRLCVRGLTSPTLTWIARAAGHYTRCEGGQLRSGT